MSGSGPERKAVSEHGRRAPTGLKTMTRALKHASRYHSWMFSQIQDFVGANVLEVGAGSGNLTQFLIDRAEVTALDESREALEVAAGRVGEARLETVIADISDPAAVASLAQQGFDTIVSSNVLEHIEDDFGTVSNMHAILKPTRGRVLLIVPAHQQLFGSLDRAAGHYRRYSRAQLTSLLRAAGFEILRARYVNVLGAIGWYIHGRVLETSDLDAWSVNVQARIFDRIAVPVLRRIEHAIEFPFGQSLVVVGQAT